MSLPGWPRNICTHICFPWRAHLHICSCTGAGQGCAARERSRSCSFAFPALKGQAEGAAPFPALHPHPPALPLQTLSARGQNLKQSPGNAQGTPAHKCHQCSPFRGDLQTFPGWRWWLEAETEGKAEQEGSWQQKGPEIRREWRHQVQTQIS